MAGDDLLTAADRAVGHFEWLLKRGALDDRKDAEPVADLRRYVDSQKNDRMKSLVGELLALLKTNPPRSEPIRAFARANAHVEGFEDMAVLILLAAEANQPTPWPAQVLMSNESRQP